MKSKVEILKAVDTCIFLGGSCSDCPYFDEHDCVNQISKDLHALLNKSDFEVVEEVLTRSKEQDWNGTGFHGEYYELERLDSMEVPPIRFDGEGNIL